MTADNFEKAGDILHSAVEMADLAARAAYLDEACKDDTELRAEVEALLRAHQKAGDFLESAPVGSDATLESFPISEGPGTVISRYRLLERVGEGGFGIVYMAEQTKPIRRRVALKIIKLGMDTKEVIARFEAERQALAMMEHPNIAKVLDAGATETGRPYFVMELVKGVPITEYCDRNNVDTRGRLELSVDVCRAVQHAHQKGIIHRDIKPSNVLITLHDGKPVPKVIDFGIAKATGQRLTEKTLFTRFAQMIGTPEYMSPEQAEFSGLDVDTRSDVYSLGVLLYQLLTGVTPLDGEKLREAGYVEMQRIIREEEPTKPSTRLSTMGDALLEVAGHRQASPDFLPKLMRGDLDWIVMKTLEKDRTLRYETASELAADIERHLNDELVLAGPPGAVYRLRKFVRRNRTSVMTGLLIATALLLVAIVSGLYAIKAETAKQETSGLLAGSYVDRAQALCEKGEIGRGMLWLADSLSIAAGSSSDLGHAVRMSLGAWQGQLNSLRAVVQYPSSAYPPSVPGFTEEPPGTYAICGLGADIWDTADQFHFVYKTLTGPGSIVARVEAVEDTHPWAKAGVMIRETLDADSKFAALYYTGGNGVRYQARITTGGSCAGDSSVTTLAHIRAPHWIRLERSFSGDFTAYDSKDGVNWYPLAWGAVNVQMAKNAYVGLVVSSHDISLVCKAVFSNVSTTGSVSGEWAEQDIGTAVNADKPRDWDQISSVAFNPDGSQILVACQDGTARFCDAFNGQPIGTPLRHGSAILTAAISPDGRRIATGGANRIVRLWDAETLEPIGEPMLHEEVSCIAFSTDGSQLMTGSTGGDIRFWNAEKGDLLNRTFSINAAGISHNSAPQGGWMVQAMAGCLDGFRVVLDTGQRSYQMFDANRGEPVGPPTVATGNRGPFAISPDGKRFAAGEGWGMIYVWDAATGELAFDPVVHGGVVHALAFNADGSRIASGGKTRLVLLWDAATGDPIGAPMRQRSNVHAVAFSPDGRSVATGNQEGVVRIWEIAQSRHVGKPVKHDDPILGAAYGPAGLRILTETEGRVQVRDATTGMPVGEPFNAPPFRFRQVVYSPDGSRIITRSSASSKLQLWDLATGKLIRDVFHLAAIFNPDGSRILTVGGSDGITRMWDVTTLERIGNRREHKDVIAGLDFSPDGSRFVTGSYDGTTLLWDAGKFEPIIGQRLVHQSEVKATAFSPDGSKILIGFADGTVRLWDVVKPKPEPIGTPLQYLRIVCGVDFSPDGSLLLACSIDKEARLWDTATLKPIGPPLEHNGWWPQASFSPDGSEILLYDRYRMTQVWQAPPGPLKGSYERIVCWVQVITGMELNQTGGINVLDVPTWQQRRRRLQELGGPPETASLGI